MTEWQKLALAVISIVDYDIAKDVESAFEEDDDTMIDELASYLESRLEFKGENRK